MFFVGKHFLSAWNVWTYRIHSFQDNLSAFFEKHFEKCGNNSSEYSFIAEFDDEFDTFDDEKFYDEKQTMHYLYSRYRD